MPDLPVNIITYVINGGIIALSLAAVVIIIRYLRHSTNKPSDTAVTENDIPSAAIPASQTPPASVSRTYAQAQQAGRHMQLAESEAAQIIAQAQQQAAQIISGAQVLSQSAQVSLNQLIEQLRSSQTQAHQQLMQNLAGETKHSVGKLADDIKDELIKEIGNFSQSMAGQIASTQEQVAKQLAGLYATAQQQADQYRADQQAGIDAKVRALVQAASTQVIGEVIDPTQHTTLIQQAIEQAKKDHVL